MDDSGFMNRCEPGDGEGGVCEPVGQGTEGLVLLDEIAQRAARGVLHCEEAVSLSVANIEDATDIRMLNRPAEAQLSLEPLLPAGIVSQSGLQNLDRHDGR